MATHPPVVKDTGYRPGADAERTPFGSPVIVPLQPWELSAVTRCRLRLEAAGRFDCTDRLDRMTTAELHALAAREGCEFLPVLWTQAREFPQSLAVHKVAATPSGHPHQEVA